MCVAWQQDPRDRPTSEQCYLQLQNPGFQALMSKIALPADSTVRMVHIVPYKDEMWILHRTCGQTFLSVFSVRFTSRQSKHDIPISTSDSVVVEACASDDAVVVLVRECPRDEVFKVFSVFDMVPAISLKCTGLPGTIIGMAVSQQIVFVASDDGCFAACWNGKSFINRNYSSSVT